MSVTELTIEERQWEMTLGGEQVVTCTMRLPRVGGTGRAVRRLTGHYRRLEKLWTDYVRRELYLYACLELARKREWGRTFRPWQGTLDSRISWQQGELAGVQLSWCERRGCGAPERRTWGDTWYTENGHVCTLGSFAPHKRLGTCWICSRPGADNLGRCREFYPAHDGLHLIGQAGKEGVVQVG